MYEMGYTQKYRMYQKTRLEEKQWVVGIDSLVSIYNGLLQRYLNRFSTFIDLEKLLVNEFVYIISDSYPYGDYTFNNVLSVHCSPYQLESFKNNFLKESEFLIRMVKNLTKGYSWHCEEIYNGYKLKIKGFKLIYD